MAGSVISGTVNAAVTMAPANSDEITGGGFHAGEGALGVGGAGMYLVALLLLAAMVEPKPGFADVPAGAVASVRLVDGVRSVQITYRNGQRLVVEDNHNVADGETDTMKRLGADSMRRAAVTEGLRERALKGDATAIAELSKRFQDGDDQAGSYLGKMYLRGNGVQRDYDAAAHYFRCPMPDDKIMTQCRDAKFSLLPPEATRLLDRMHCEYSDDDAQVADLDLANRTSQTFALCCKQPDHGPCRGVVIGKVHGTWKNIGGGTGIDEYFGCSSLMPLKSRTNGFHDVCIPGQPSAVTPIPKAGQYYPAVWRFTRGSYREVANPVQHR